jgi:hypothetical protein
VHAHSVTTHGHDPVRIAEPILDILSSPALSPLAFRLLLPHTFDLASSQNDPLSGAMPCPALESMRAVMRLCSVVGIDTV